MADYKKNTRFSGGSSRPFNKAPGRSFGAPGGNRFGGDQKELFKAECNSCRKECQVPFRPNGKKPVYCSDCFKQENGGGDRPQGSRFVKREYSPRPSFNNAPAPQAPDRRIDDIKRQLDTMNATLEKLVATLEASTRATALTKAVRKYVPADKPASAPVKKATAKKEATKKAAKSAKK